MERAGQGYYRQAEAALTRLATAVERREPIDLAELTRIAGEIVDAIQSNDQLVVEAMSSPEGPPLVTNLVNVGILATKVGIGLGYYGEELRRLALAGLLHDIGIFAIPQNLLKKSGRLTSEERALVEQHPRLGSEIIQRLGADYAWLAEVVLQAHERGKGQGYPNKLKGREINELAQIIGLMDIFDALISPRPYRRRLLPHEAVRELLVTERTAFPREIMKALVEQLSVYPLGTKVRLSSGEEGVVIRINPRYPARPVVRIVEENEPAGGTAPRTLDLGQWPLVSVVETIDAPALERVSFGTSAPPPAAGPSGRATGTSTDQFAALLESLDAIADVIQSAVVRQAPQTQEPSPASGTEPSDSTGEIRREILGLFALEAREWLNQIQTALERLDRTTEQPRRVRLANLMLQGVTNLAKSAATVRLTAIEEMATNLLPLLQAAGKHERTVAAHHLASLRDGLSRITQTVHELSPAEEAAPKDRRPIAGPEPLERPLVQAAVASPEPRGEAPHEQPTPALTTTLPILDALRQLHEARGRSLQPIRDVLETVIQRAEQEIERGGEVTDARAIGRILKELDEQDEYFLGQMQARVPALVATLSNITSGNAGAPHPQALTSVLQDIDGLYEAADRVSASNITMFLHGLRTFLLVTAQNRPSAVGERLAAVQERLAALVPLAQQWVDIGRLERTAIFEILPLA